MLSRTIGVAFVFLLSACASANRNIAAAPAELASAPSQPRLFVGHDVGGQIVVAANHYDAMNGLAVEDTDLGIAPGGDVDGQMLCVREVPTGSHLPHWVCRYKAALDAEREFTQQKLNEVRLAFDKPQQGVFMMGGGGAGGGGGGGHPLPR
jgi:hypothetical protein